MSIKKLIHIAIVVSLVLVMSGCSTLDMMVGLKDENKQLEIYNDDFAFIDDDISDEEVVDTITINSDQQMRNVIAYYKDANNLLVPVKAEIPWEEGIAKATLRKMVIGDAIEIELSHSGLKGVLPEGTEILGMSIEDGLCIVDFNSNILNTTSMEEEKLMMTALAYTLTEFDTIDRVEIVVDGQEMQVLTFGYPVDVAFERENINLVGSEDGANYTVYYKTPETEVAGFYVPFTFTADTVDNPVKVVMDKLFNGPPEELVVQNEIPYGITLNSVSLNQGVADLDLSMGALNLKQEDYEELNKIVVLCLQQFGEISEVNYSIEGITFEEAGLNIEDSEVKAVFNNFK
ncbi:GerMN domain-containing protein [Sedimentibacter sp. zth1]|uniref:GerMN domain-containing protein n=1 Tax=Sedimentibacter sp. zth1 TaxID=2816908 RepID=UPI001A9318A0|nr:GerMN domain-containing protein [Sedimentibacter sp. zth1]QSX05087.1 GerMN domain-containing protein [Sedimentibacter sp. zth1]